MQVKTADLARRIGLPTNASESLVRARLAGLEAADQVRASSTAGSDRRQPAAIAHEAFMRQFFPTVADKLGYVTPYVGGFLMGSAARSPDSPVRASSTPARAASVEEQAHRELMARHYPGVGSGPFESPRASVRHYA
jgi:hypothetical protein